MADKLTIEQIAALKALQQAILSRLGRIKEMVPVDALVGSLLNLVAVILVSERLDLESAKSLLETHYAKCWVEARSN